MAFDADCHLLAQRALELQSQAPVVQHEPAECEMCAEYQRDLMEFARTALPKLAEGYLQLSHRSMEAFENAKLRGRFLEDLQEENQRLQKELLAREEELDELLRDDPSRKGWRR